MFTRRMRGLPTRCYDPYTIGLPSSSRADGSADWLMRFSAAIVRAQLGSLFRCAGGANGGPLALVGCAPEEEHEIGPWMLALFLRRAGLRMAYVGQSLEPRGLLAAVMRSRSHGTCGGDYSAHGDGNHF